MTFYILFLFFNSELNLEFENLEQCSMRCRNALCRSVHHDMCARTQQQNGRYGLKGKGRALCERCTF